MVQWRVRKIAEERGITSAAELANRAGIAINTAYSLWVGRSLRADRATITSVCKVLDCTPGDILVMDEEDLKQTLEESFEENNTPLPMVA
jgi:DNA-binding Xre family transcriptional regulator